MTVDRPGASDTPSGPDEVPGEVADAARAAFSAHDPQAVLAELVRDSLDDERADPAGRELVFAVADRTVTVRLDSGEPGRVSVDVDPAPDGPLELDVRPEQALVVLSRKGPGRWSVSPVPTGPASFVVTHGSHRLRTAWTRF